MSKDAFKGFDPERLSELYLQRSADRQKILTEARIAAEAKIAAMQSEFDYYVVEARRNGATWAAMARVLGKSETVLRKAAERVTKMEDLRREYLERSLGAGKREASKFAIRREFRGKIHVATDPARFDDGVVNVYLDPREMRVLNVSEYENGAHEHLSGPLVDAWQAELDTEGSALRLTVEDWLAENA